MSPSNLRLRLRRKPGERAGHVVDVFDGDAAPRVLLVLTVGARRVDVGEAFDLLFDESFVFLFGREHRLEARHGVHATSTSSTRSSRLDQRQVVQRLKYEVLALIGTGMTCDYLRAA